MVPSDDATHTANVLSPTGGQAQRVRRSQRTLRCLPVFLLAGHHRGTSHQQPAESRFSGPASQAPSRSHGLVQCSTLREPYLMLSPSPLPAIPHSPPLLSEFPPKVFSQHNHLLFSTQRATVPPKATHLALMRLSNSTLRTCLDVLAWRLSIRPDSTLPYQRMSYH